MNTAAKYHLPPKSKENFLRYLDLCYVNPAYHKLKTSPSIIGCEPMRSFKKVFSQNLPPLR